MKNVLLVTPYFAPQTHAAMFRVHKLAKYLPDFGWAPHVLTVDTNYLYNENPKLLDELPKEVEITQARYIEPTVRGLRMALGGENRTFVAMKGQLTLTEVSAPDNSGYLKSRLHRLYAGPIQEYLGSPDAYWTWKRSALREAGRIIHERDIRTIYTTSTPYTSLEIAMQLQKKMGVRWVADLRDPLTYAQKVSSSSSRIRKVQRELVAETLRRADAVTALSSSYAPILTDMYGAITKRPIEFIPTGIDQRLLEAEPSFPLINELSLPYVVFAGEIMPEQTREFFEIWQAAENRSGLLYDIVVIGHEIINRRRLEPILRNLNLRATVRYFDHIPQEHLYSIIQWSKAALLVPGRNEYWWNNFAKLVDYVGLRKPVLAVVPDPSEARSVLTRANLGIFLDGSIDEAATTLAGFLSGQFELGEPVSSECDRYLASSQVESFARLFDELMGATS